jgi:hypothetical protein
MVASLLEYETVEADEVKAILENRPFNRGGGTPEIAGTPAPTPAEEGKPRVEQPKRLPPNISPEPA